MAIIPKGQEPANVKKRIETLFPKLNEVYPDKVIVSLQRDHKKWDETAREISRQLGYDSKNDFLIAYGYTILLFQLPPIARKLRNKIKRMPNCF